MWRVSGAGMETSQVRRRLSLATAATPEQRAETRSRARSRAQHQLRQIILPHLLALDCSPPDQQHAARVSQQHLHNKDRGVQDQERRVLDGGVPQQQETR